MMSDFTSKEKLPLYPEDAFLDTLLNHLSLQEIPEQKAKVEQFIAAGKKFATDYQIDHDIHYRNQGVSIILYADHFVSTPAYKKQMEHLLRICSSFDILRSDREEYDLMFILSLKTHDAYLKTANSN